MKFVPEIGSIDGRAYSNFFSFQFAKETVTNIIIKKKAKAKPV